MNKLWSHIASAIHSSNEHSPYLPFQTHESTSQQHDKTRIDDITAQRTGLRLTENSLVNKVLRFVSSNELSTKWRLWLQMATSLGDSLHGKHSYDLMIPSVLVRSLLHGYSAECVK